MADKYLYHHGVKGMKWGRRKSEPKVSKKSQRVRLVETKNRVKDSYSYKALNSDGKKIGSLYLRKDPNNELNMEWINVKKKHQNKGYASDMIRQVDAIAKSKGATKITAEAVGTGSIRHLLEKHGYKTVGELKDSSNMNTWNGLALVEKKLKK